MGDTTTTTPNPVETTTQTPSPAVDGKASAPAAATGEGKAAAAAATTPTAKPAIPEKYELKLPDGTSLDAKATEEVAAYAKAQGLSNEQAQALLDRDSKNLSAFVKTKADQLTAQSQAWVEQASGDKEFGGEGFKKNIELAKSVVAKYGSEALKRDLDSTGLGNHPELVRMLYRIGKSMDSDTLVTGTPKGAKDAKKSAEEVLYGGSAQSGGN